MQKLYFLYSIVSNKTVRQKENFKRVFKRKNKYVLGQLVKTNRGYFIDGKHVDLKSANYWLFLNDNQEAAKQAGVEWHNYLKELRAKEK
jgi:hypothetical protein